MKAKKTARDKRTEENKKRQEQWHQPAPTPKPVSKPRAPVKPIATRAEIRRQQEADTREFLAYLEKDIVIQKEEPAVRKRNTQRIRIADLNLEEGMPVVEEALSRMNIGLQALRTSGVKLVRLIHGYGSTGRGGKICIAARKELATLKKQHKIRTFVAGEDFGPFSAEIRAITDQFPELARDPDYGCCNHGITIVLL